MKDVDSTTQYMTVCCSVLQCVAVCCSVLQCVAVCCSVLQCVAVCCSVLQCVDSTTRYVISYSAQYISCVYMGWLRLVGSLKL